MPNPGGHFKFKVGQRVWLQYPGTSGQWVRIKARTTEAALGKTYLCISRKQNHGYCPEERISESRPEA